MHGWGGGAQRSGHLPFPNRRVLRTTVLLFIPHPLTALCPTKEPLVAAAAAPGGAGNGLAAGQTLGLRPLLPLQAACRSVAPPAACPPAARCTGGCRTRRGGTTAARRMVWGWCTASCRRQSRRCVLAHRQTRHVHCWWPLPTRSATARTDPCSFEAAPAPRRAPLLSQIQPL